MNNYFVRVLIFKAIASPLQSFSSLPVQQQTITRFLGCNEKIFSFREPQVIPRNLTTELG